jgi:hypothetical protein
VLFSRTASVGCADRAGGHWRSGDRVAFGSPNRTMLAVVMRRKAVKLRKPQSVKLQNSAWDYAKWKAAVQIAIVVTTASGSGIPTRISR